MIIFLIVEDNELNQAQLCEIQRDQYSVLAHRGHAGHGSQPLSASDHCCARVWDSFR